MTLHEVEVPAVREGRQVAARVRFASGVVCRVEVFVEGSVLSGEGPDLFEALVAARRELERRGVLLGCNGCRRDVYPSPMLRQAAQGRRAYVLAVPRTADKPPVVDIFEAAADLSNIATVDEQRAWFEQWRPAAGEAVSD